MNPTNVALAIQLAIDLITRGMTALALAKRGDVTDAELDDLVKADDAAKAALDQAIKDARDVPPGG
jgi:hypothetical protein